MAIENSTDFRDQFLCGDCLATMKSMPSESIDLVVTSPPYNLKNSTGNGMKDGRGGKWSNASLINGYSHHDDCMPHEEYAAWQRDCLAEMFRLIKNDALFFITINGECKQDYYKIGRILSRASQFARLLFGEEKAA